MTQRNHSAENRLHQLWQQSLSTRRFASTLPAQSLAWLGSISMLSNGGLVLAQTESQIDNIVPVESSQPTPAANPIKKDSVEQNNNTPAVEAAQSQPEFSQRRARLTQRLSKSKTSSPAVVIGNSKPRTEDSDSEVANRKSKPQVEVSAPTESVRKWRARLEKKPQVETSRSSTTMNEEKPKQEVSPQENNNSPASSANNSTPKDYNNAYIDPNQYNVGATDKYQAPNSVMITERSNTELPQKKAPSWIRRSKPATLATVPPVRRVATGERSSLVRSTPGIVSGVVTSTLRRRTSQMASSSVTKDTYRPNRFIPNFTPNTPNTTVSSVPIAPSGGSLPAPVTAENVAPRLSNVTYDIPLAAVLPQINYGGIYGGRLASGSGLMYPLSVPSVMTSLFGWRVHPITGDRRFHSGTDIGAAMGTPVLAAYPGKVESADWLGGYGLAVILNHSNAQQTLYGHMSEIFVQPGQWVEQGTVIGRVGSTGNSTGPHLHFEVRQLTPEGWVATDPGAQLEYALGQLIQSLHTAQAPQQPGS
ncbi:MAG: peptidoglycan DD-metalloendopeptidase family protein [Iphinoe sp. HA4291-MV1]|jgi:murein DD-endopeptidase MepM/ murein hydrolase activator NlpD|nr:peptidoglycan DD-metalloendopeptidase family protein [Iphinoe sp. HA4291-MV1]